MAAFVGDFDDAENNDASGPLLPKEDRLWRHPSELSDPSARLGIDPTLVRRRWLQSQPSRASAWTAGLVGAILATGLVAVGTHLASAFTNPTAGTQSIKATVTSVPLPQVNGIVSPALRSSVVAVSSALVVVQATSGSVEERFIGLGVRKDGMLIVPSAAIGSMSSVVVTLPQGGSYVGDLVATDQTSGLSLVHISGVNDLPVVHLDPNASLTNGSYALAVTSSSPRQTTLVFGSIGSSEAGSGSDVADTVNTTFDPKHTPLGSALLDSSGRVVGIVTTTNATDVVATPSWMAAPVVNELIAYGSVTHGWLGIEGETYRSPSGVKVVSVLTPSAAWNAGIRPGDIIWSVNGARVPTMGSLLGRLYVEQPKTTVAISVLRKGRTLALHAVLDASEK